MAAITKAGELSERLVAFRAEKKVDMQQVLRRVGIVVAEVEGDTYELDGFRFELDADGDLKVWLRCAICEQESYTGYLSPRDGERELLGQLARAKCEMCAARAMAPTDWERCAAALEALAAHFVPGWTPPGREQVLR